MLYSKDSVWSKVINLSPDNLFLINIIVLVLKPIRNATKQLSFSSTWAIPMLTSTADAVHEINVLTSALYVRNLLSGSLSVRIQILLGADEDLPEPG